MTGEPQLGSYEEHMSGMQLLTKDWRRAWGREEEEEEGRREEDGNFGMFLSLSLK